MKIQAVIISYLIALGKKKNPLENARLKGSILKPGFLPHLRTAAGRKAATGGRMSGWVLLFPLLPSFLLHIDYLCFQQRKDKGNRKVLT